jgi:predicted GIY-YIG superfamily endonuclease
LTDGDHYEGEKSKLRVIFQQNGYKVKEIRRVLDKMDRLKQDENRGVSTDTIEKGMSESSLDEIKAIAVLPYVPKIGEKIKKVLSKNNIFTAFKADRKVSSMIRTVKDQVPLDCKGVYEVSCECGKVYIGETGRKISTRVKEHERHIRLAKQSNTFGEKQRHLNQSACAEHGEEFKHNIQIDKVRVLCRDERKYTRKVREAIEIKKQPNNFNRDDSFQLDRAWGTVLQQKNRIEGIIEEVEDQENVKQATEGNGWADRLRSRVTKL